MASSHDRDDTAHNESWRNFFLISSGVAVSFTSRISYGLFQKGVGQNSKGREREEISVLELKGFEDSIHLHLTLKRRRLAI